MNGSSLLIIQADMATIPDPHGKAILDYWHERQEFPLLLHTSYGPVEEMPVDIYFRKYDQMTDLEHLAIDSCKGTVIDVGAGAGCFSVVLEVLGHKVIALDNSPGCTEVLKAQEIGNVELADLYQYNGPKADTLLLMMNGLGLAGKLGNMPKFLKKLRSLLKPGGAVIADSSDISYLYKRKGKPEDRYFGEVKFQFEYEGEKGGWFDWLYIDPATLKHVAQREGWKVEVLYKDKTDAYLVRLSPL